MKWFTGIFLLIFIILPLQAQESAVSVAQKASETNLGFVSLAADMTMSIFRSQEDNDPTVRQYVFKFREGQRGNDRALIDFKSPTTINGTRMLAIGQANKDNEQWLYLPAFNRTRKIAQSSISSAFVGSDFSFEDLSPLSFDKYDYNDVVEKSMLLVEGKACPVYKIIRTAKYKNSAYDQQQVWIEQVSYRILQIDGYRAGVKIKSVNFNGYRLYDKYSWPDIIRMNNLQKGSYTTLTTQSVQFGSERALDREFNSELLGD